MKKIFVSIVLLFVTLVIAGCASDGSESKETITYTVTYDGNGETSGSVPIDTKQYSLGETVTVLENTGNLTKTNYTSAGWNTKSDEVELHIWQVKPFKSMPLLHSTLCG